MAKTIEIEVEVETKDAVRGVDNLEKSYDRLADAIESANEIAEESAKKVAEQLEKQKQAIIDSKKPLAVLKKSFKGLGTAIKGLGIGLIIAAFLALKEALGKNQKALDFVNTATTAVGIVFNDLFNFISDNFTPAIESISNAFSDIPATLVKVKDAIVNNIEVRFNAVIDTLGLLGDAIKKVFSGDFSGALDDAEDAAKKFVDVQTGVENTVDRIVDGVGDLVDATVAYTDSLIENSKAIISNEQAGELLELQQTRIREQSDRDAERQRQIRDDFTKSFADRIKANEKLGEILEAQEIAETASVQKRINALQAEQNALGFNFERRKEIFALNTELIAIEAQQAGFKSEQQINAINLEKEQAEAKKAELEAEAALEKERSDAKLVRQKEAQSEADKIFDKALKDSKKRSDEEDAYNKKVQENKVALVGQATGAILANLEEGSNAAKSVAAAQVLFDTYRGIQGAFASATANPVTGAFPVYPFIQAAAASAFGFANLKNILSAKTAKPSSGASTPNVSTPSASASTSGLSQDALFSSGSLEAPDTETIGGSAGLNQQPVQAIVLESDITNTQNRINNYQERSEIG